MKTIEQSWPIDNIEDLQNALRTILTQTGDHPSVINIDPPTTIALQKTVLSDNSAVFDLLFTAQDLT